MNGLTNFRDLGGIKTSDGRVVKVNRLLRAAQPVGLSEEEISKLIKSNLKVIIDFRTSNEAARTPVDNIGGASYLHIDIMGANDTQAADPNHWVQMLAENPHGVELQFIETYKEFATGESSRRGYGNFLRACASQSDGAILFHCAAGKDRTGLAAALILRVLGITDEDIYTDYLKSMEFQEKISAPYLAMAKAAGMTDQQVEYLKVLLGVKKEFLSAALTAAEEKYGSFENYITEGLGVTPEEIERIRDLYLE